MLMTVENQVCTLEQAKKLKELGVVLDSLFVHDEYPFEEGSSCVRLRVDDTHDYSGKPAAYTVAELGEMIPTLGFEFVKSNNGNGKDFFWLSSHYWRVKNVKFESEFEADARAKMLIYLLESSVLEVEDVNKKLQQTANNSTACH